MGPFCGASLNPRALWAKNRLKGLLRVDAGDEVAGFGGDDVVDVGLQLLVDRYGSLAGGGEGGSAGAVALDAKGEARVALKMPDFNGTVRVTAQVFGENQYGGNDVETVVRAPLVAEITR